MFYPENIRYYDIRIIAMYLLPIHLFFVTALYRCLLVTVDPNDDNYMPHLIEVKGGDGVNMKKIGEVLVDW